MAGGRRAHRRRFRRRRRTLDSQHAPFRAAFLITVASTGRAHWRTRSAAGVVEPRSASFLNRVRKFDSCRPTAAKSGGRTASWWLSAGVRAEILARLPRRALSQRQRLAEHRQESKRMRTVGDGHRHLVPRTTRNHRDLPVLRQPGPRMQRLGSAAHAQQAALASMLDREQSKRLSPDVPAQLELRERLPRARKDRSRAEMAGQSLEGQLQWCGSLKAIPTIA